MEIGYAVHPRPWTGTMRRTAQRNTENPAGFLTTGRADCGASGEMVAALHRRGDGDTVRQMIEQRCPRCGAEHGLQRYRCAAGPAAQEGMLGILRQLAPAIPFGARSGAPDWGRQECLIPLVPPLSEPDNDALKQTLAGIIEVDESFILESPKGERGCQEKRANAATRRKSPGFRTNRPQC